MSQVILALIETQKSFTNVLEWLRENPLVVLTGALVIVTTIYTFYMAKSVRILSEGFMANIEPYLSARLTNPGRTGSDVWGNVELTVEHAPAILQDGYVWLACQHGQKKAMTNLTQFRDHRLLPQERLQFSVTARFDHLADPHACSPTLEGYIHFTDSKALGHYWVSIEPSGKVRSREARLGGRVARAKAWAHVKWGNISFWWRFGRKQKKQSK